MHERHVNDQPSLPVARDPDDILASWSRRAFERCAIDVCSEVVIIRMIIGTFALRTPVKTFDM